MSRFQFVEDHRGAFGVKRLCLVLKVSRAGFYRWLSGADVRAGRQRADAELAERIGEIHRDSDGTYGVPRVTAELREAGVRVNHKRVARIMRTWGIVGLHLRHLSPGRGWPVFVSGDGVGPVLETAGGLVHR